MGEDRSESEAADLKDPARMTGTGGKTFLS
jgi:hypothetical protein